MHSLDRLPFSCTFPRDVPPEWWSALLLMPCSIGCENLCNSACCPSSSAQQLINIMFFLHKICSSQREKNETRQISLLVCSLPRLFGQTLVLHTQKQSKLHTPNVRMFIRLSYFFTSTNNTCFCQKRDLQTRILVKAHNTDTNTRTNR